MYILCGGYILRIEHQLLTDERSEIGFKRNVKLQVFDVNL